MVLRKRCRRPIHAIERAFLAFEIDGGWSVVVCSNSSVLEKADQTTPYLLCAFDIALGKGKSYAENANRDRKRRDETRRDETHVRIYPDLELDACPPLWSKINLCRHLWASDLQKWEILTSSLVCNKTAYVDENISLIVSIFSKNSTSRRNGTKSVNR